MPVSHRSMITLLFAMCAAFAHTDAFSQDAAAPPTHGAIGTESAPPASTTAASCCALTDGTVIELEIAEPLSTKTAQRGQRFKLRLAAPVRVGDIVALPSGIEGVGEVVHADRARAAGKPGELLLAARTLNGPNGEIKLRGFKFGGSGENRTTAAFWIPLGFFVRGGQVEVPVGARAHAKLAGTYTVPPAASASTGDRDVATNASSPEPPQSVTPTDPGTETPQH